MNDGKLLEEIERYLNGEMNADERKQFEALSNSDAAIAQKITEQKEFLKVLKQYSDRLALEARLNEIHEEIDVHTMADELIVHPSAVVRMWRNHHSKISVAASIAIFAVLSLLFLTGKFNNDSKYVQLSRKVGNLEVKVNQNQRATQGNTHASHNVNAIDRFRATGFAITADGLIATNYHVVGDNDSVYVQNAAGKLFKAKVVFVAPGTDIAILKITDTAFRGLATIPYTFKRSESDLAENVYTYGYSQDSPIFNRGELTSANGLNGDSTKYQVSIPLRPGNSGGPLIDSRGNVIGVVNAKETQVDGVNLNFAIKSTYLLSAIDSVSKQDDAKVILNTKNTMANMTTVQQLKKLKNYVFMVKVGL